MKHILFQEHETYDVALLIKSTSFSKQELYKSYASSIEQFATCIAFDLKYENNKTSAAIAKEYLAKLLPALKNLGVKYLYVADSQYFKFLTKVPKADAYFGYVLPCKIKDFEDFMCVLGVNHQQLIFNPSLQSKIDHGLSSLKNHVHGTYVPAGSSIIHSAAYPEGSESIQEVLNSLHQYPSLTCDIEGFSLRFWEAGIASIAFAWDEHNGIAFEVDDIKSKKPKQSIRYLLKKFFEKYKGKLTFHKANYDLKALIFNLWMRDPLDHVGMLTGLDVMTRDVEDTLIVSYLAINSTAGNKLSLKELAQEFAGSYSIEVSDVTVIEKSKLLEYNLIDALCTQYVYKKNYPKLVNDSQEQIYRELLLPALKVLVQTELVGMPMNDERISALELELATYRDKALNAIMSAPEIVEATKALQVEAMTKANAKLKTKQHPLEKFKDLQFNPNSGPQLQKLLYETMGLPVLNKTASGQPSTDGDTLELLLNHCQPNQKDLLVAFNDYSDAEKILSTFIPAFKAGLLKKDGNRYLHGSFNIGGTVSGRLSSSDPNLQNLPSNSLFGKAVKKVFVGNQDWIMVGADFSSLEDYVSALLTKDKNKLKVYEGHKVYELVIDGQTHHVRDDTIIEYDGKSMTAESFYETYRTF
jgi:DNA polymerase-1